ncbi:MAG: TetR/AcrR family transcriptional regulator [Acidobacteriota bacterium]
MSPTDTRTAILDLTEELVRSRSFNAFSYQDIADRIGIRKASVHYHFPSKEDLGVALVERLRRQAVAWASAQVERNASPLQKFDAYLSFQAESLRQGDMICPQGILGAEYNALPERVKESYIEFLEQIQTWLASVLRKGQKQGVFSRDASPEDQAALIQSATQGALQLSRASGRDERYYAVVQWLREHIVRQQAVAETEPAPDGE